MKPDQLELKEAASVFNLAQETTQDGAALAADMARRQLDRQEAEKAQKPLFDLEPAKTRPLALH